MLPQVLAGLGFLGVLSAGCLFWLEKLQPVFLALAIVSMVYQLVVYLRRPPFLRTWGIKLILFSSVFLNLSVVGLWITFWLRYR